MEQLTFTARTWHLTFTVFLIGTTLSHAYAGGCSTHEEPQNFAYVSQVYLGQIVAEETRRSSYAIGKAIDEPDVIAHDVKVLEVFRGEVPSKITLLSRYLPGGFIIGDGDWREGQVGQYWLIMGQHDSCMGSFQVKPEELVEVTARFFALAENTTTAPPRRDADLEAYSKARSLMRLGYYPEAETILEQLINEGSRHSEWAAESLTEARAVFGDRWSAIRSYRELLRVHPPKAGDPASVNKLIKFGTLLYDDGRIDEGLAQLREAADLTPSYTHAAWELARRLDEQFRPDEAEAVIENHFESYCSAENYNGCLENAHWVTGELYVRARRKHKAYEHYKFGIQPERLTVHKMKQVLKLGRSILRSDDAAAWALEIGEAAHRVGLAPAQLELVDILLAGLRASKD